VAAIEGKTAFVFSGGGSLGAIQVGMLRVLLSYGLKPDFVVGASVGAINASYFASAPDAECVARLAQIWSGLLRADIFPFTLTSAFGLIRRRGHIVDPGKLRRVVETNLPCSRIEDAKIPLHIMATYYGDRSGGSSETVSCSAFCAAIAAS
jgi:NTE family protein